MVRLACMCVFRSQGTIPSLGLDGGHSPGRPKPNTEKCCCQEDTKERRGPWRLLKEREALLQKGACQGQSSLVPPVSLSLAMKVTCVSTPNDWPRPVGRGYLYILCPRHRDVIRPTYGQPALLTLQLHWPCPYLGSSRKAQL